MTWLEYANQSAIRNQPLDPRLVETMGFLPELGVTMRVISGGQEGKGEGDRRTGSTRHDHGGAADADFFMNGRKLDWNNPDDQPIFSEIVRRARANGVTGIGAGDDYMGAGRMHIGFGSEAVWGAGGKGENAPEWLRTAYYNSAPSQNALAGGQYTASAPSGPQNALAAPQGAPAAPGNALRQGPRMVDTRQDVRNFLMPTQAPQYLRFT